MKKINVNMIESVERTKNSVKLIMSSGDTVSKKFDTVLNAELFEASITQKGKITDWLEVL